MITAKELLKVLLVGDLSLSDIFDLADKDASFYREGSKDKFYEELAQKIIDLVKE